MDAIRRFSDLFLAPLTDNGCTTTNVFFSIAIFIGVYSILKFFINLVLGLSATCRSSGNLRARYGSWGVVTGATDGIGFAYAKQLAKRGLNIVLVSRTQSKLDDCAAAIKELYPKVETRCIAADFSDTSAALYDHIREGLAGLEIGVLVNNVGMSYPGAMFFDEIDSVDDKLIDNLIALNVNSTTQMTRMVIGDMVRRRQGAIINISSAAGRIPTGNPLYAVYSATKAYVDFFSRSLHYEMAGRGVHVQCQSPYFVTSKLSKIRRSSLTTPNPDTYAKAAVNAIGSGDSVVPFWAHTLQDWVLQALPKSLVAKYVVGLHLGLRKRFMDKLKKN